MGFSKRSRYREPYISVQPLLKGLLFIAWPRLQPFFDPWLFGHPGHQPPQLGTVVQEFDPDLCVEVSHPLAEVRAGRTRQAVKRVEHGQIGPGELVKKKRVFFFS